MSNCKLFSTNFKFYDIVKKKLLSYSGDPEQFLDFVAQKSLEFKKNTLVSKFVTDQDVAEIANEIIEENPDRFSSITASGVTETISKKITKNKSGIVSQFVITNNIREPFKSSQSAYDYMESEFRINMFKSAFINKEKGLIVKTDKQLNKYLTEYKNSLFNTLKEYINLNTKEDLYNEDSIVNYDLYERVMTDLSITSIYNKNFNISPLIKSHRESLFNIVNAIYILNNFDTLVKELIPGIITINQDYFGYLDNGLDLQKYSLSSATLQSLYWKADNDEVKDATLYVSNLTKLISSIIPLVDKNGNTIYGKFLGRNALYKISALIKKAEMDNMKKNPTTFESFISNPTKMLKYYLKSSGYDSLDNNEKIVKSLAKFLYDDSDIEIDGQKIQNTSINTIQNNIFTDNINGNLTNNVDILGLLAFEISKIVSPEYKKYNVKGSSTIELSSLDEATGFIKDSIKVNLLGYLDDTTSDNPYFIKKLKINGIEVDISSNEAINDLNKDQINSIEFKNYFYSISGLELTNKLIDDLNYSNLGHAVSIIKNMTKNITSSFNLIKNELKNVKYEDPKEDGNRQDFIDNTIDSKLNNTNYVSFSRAIASDIDNNIVTVIEDSQGNKIPVYRLNSAMFNDAYYIKNYNYSDNLFVNNPNLLSNDNNIDYNTSTSLRLEGESDSGTVKKASNYSSDESFYASFFGDYLTSIYKNDIFSTQPVAYSDKSSILLKNINLKAKIKVSDEVYNIYKEDNKSKTEIKGIKEVSLGDLSNNALKQLYFEYQKSYFENIVSDTVKDWSKIIPGLDTKNVLESINKINNYLKDTHPTKDGKNPSIYSSILNLKKQGINVNIVNELHYSKYDKLEFNRDLLNNYTNTRTKATFDKFFKKGLNTFVDKKFSSELLSPSRLNISNSTIEGIGVDNLVSKLFGKGSIDYSNFNKFTTKDPLIKENILSIESKVGNEINPLLERYLLLTNFVKDQYLGLTVKHPYIHKIKYKGQSTEDESSDRVKASMKRMVILPATLENYTQGLLNGVPKKYKVAIVEDDGLPVFNHKGEIKNQDIYDGSAWSNPIMAILEDNSLPSKGIKGTKKPIGTYSGNGYSMLFKYAQFPLTNELILNSSSAKNSMFSMMEKMNNLQWKHENGKYYNIDITKNFKGGNFQPDNALNKSLYIISGDKYLKVLSIQNLNIFDSTIGNTYKIVYEVVDINGNPIKVDGKTQREIVSKPINSIFQLWQVLGGQYSMELIDGKLDYSENSISAVAQYVNNIGILKDTEAINKGFNFKNIEKIVTDYNTETVYQPLKDFMIGILANSSAVKNGITNLNPSSVLLGDDELIYSEIDVTNFGIQLDANHEADFSELTEMSQVISALSANGHTQTEAKKAFKEIANIIKTSMSKTTMMVNNEKMHEMLYDEMSKILVNTLASANKISLAHSIVSQVKSRLEDGFNDLIPISNPNFFNLFTTDVLSRLNRSALKRKYSGLGGVLNPSAKIVEMFEDKNGNTYNWKDLLNNAIEEYKNGELQELISDNDRIIYGHNTLGKSYLFSGKNSPFVSLDDDFKPDQDKFIDENKLPTETRQDYKARHPEEYNKFLLDLWEITKQTALSQNKKAIVSNHHILRQKPEDFDKVFTLTPTEFKRRLIQRGSTEEELNKINPLTGKTTFNDWKDNLDEAVSNVDSSKVVITNKYLSDLVVNNENLVKAYITKYFSNDVITKDKINLFDTIDIKDALGNIISRKEILTPGDLYDLQKLPNDLVFEKVYSVSRDLKPMNITWDDGVNQSNIWNLPSIKLKFNLKNIIKDPAKYKQEGFLLGEFLKFVQKDKENLFEDFLNGKNLTRINNELNNWTQKLTEQLQQGKIFDESFLLINDFNSYFNSSIPVNNVQISEAEIVLPKTNRTVFKMNNNSLAQIQKEGANYFKKELSSNYDAPIEGLDFFIRTEYDSIGVRIGEFKDKTINGVQGNIVKLNKETDEDGIVYRLNEKGDRMYILPKNSEVYVYDLNGKAVEVVYLPDSFEKVNEKEYIRNGKLTTSLVNEIINEDYNNFIKSVKDRSSLVILGNNLNSILKLKLLTDLGSKYNHVREYKELYSNISYEISPMWSNEEYQERLLTMKEALLEEFQNKDYYLDGIANSMYTSFLKSLNVISARIPSQALQSFMPMKTIGFTENKSNDIYVSHWQLWLQGSDLDIDKAYTMMYSINDSGIYDYWSPLFDFSSLESLTLSENLPTPNKHKIKFNNTSIKSKQLNVIQVSSNEEIPENGINITPYLIAPYSLENIIPLLELIDLSIENNNLTFYSTLEDKFDILDKVNEHNTYKVSQDSSKNKVVKSIRSVSNDLRNLLSAYSPISMDDFTNLLKTIDSADKKSIYDGYSVFEIQEENYIGKSVVGVMANGVKAFFTLTQYFNNYFSKGNVDILDNEFFIKEFNITGTPIYKSTIADIKFNENQFAIFNQYLQIAAPEAYKKGITIRHDNHDASLLLSALVSLATDNAKELALAKLNAGLEMASMHVYLTIMGFTPEEIVSYMTSPMVNDIAKNLKSNIFTGKETTIAKVIGQLVKDELPGIEEFNNIYQSAQELRHFTNQLSINQGVKSDIYTIKDFTLKLSNGFESAESLIFKGIPLTLDKKAKKDKAKFYRKQIRPLKEKIKEESEKPDTDKDSELIEKLTLEYDTKLKLYLEPIVINDKDKVDLINKLAVKIKNNKPYFDGLVEEKQKEVDDHIYNVLNNAIDLNILGNRLDFDKYFSDKNYREGVTNYYNLIKNTFNYFDVINKSPNFFEMLTSLNTTLNSIKIVSKKADFIFNEVPQIIKDNQELLKDSVMIRKGDDSDSNKFVDKNGRLFKYNSEFLRKSLDYYDDYVIGDFLASDSLQHFKFNISDLSNLLNKDIKLADKGYITSNNRYFDLSNGDGIRQFKYIMEHYIIKQILKKEYNDNAFVKNLQLNVDKKTNKNIYSKNKSFYKLAINMKDLTTPSDINLYFELLNGFNRLSEQDSPIQNVYGENLKWGELLYAYNLIINKDKFGPNRLTKIFEDYMHKENSLAYKLAMHYGKFEKGDKKLDVDAKNLFFSLFAYNKDQSISFTDGQRIKLTDPDYTIITKLDKYYELENNKVNKIMMYLKNNGFLLDLICE